MKISEKVEILTDKQKVLIRKSGFQEEYITEIENALDQESTEKTKLLRDIFKRLQEEKVIEINRQYTTDYQQIAESLIENFPAGKYCRTVLLSKYC